MIILKIVNGNVFFKQKNKEVYPYLVENRTCNICIIGGGLSSLITAYFLSKKEKDVIIVEKNIIGYGQSLGACSIADIDLNAITKLKKREDIMKLYEVYKEARSDLKKMLDEIGVKYNEIDKYSYTNKIMQKGNMQKNINLKSQLFNVGGELIDKIEGIDSVLNIKWEDKTIVLNPGEMIQKLAKYLLEKQNVTIYENTEIVNVDPQYEIVKMVTNNNFFITANKVVYATGMDVLKTIDVNVMTYQKYTVVTEKIKENVGKEKVMCNFNADGGEYIQFLNSGNTVITGEDTKINMKMLDENYKESMDTSKYTKLIVQLNKLLDMSEYIDKGMCYSTIYAKTFDMLPIIDEIECMPNCFVICSFGHGTILNGIVGGKILRNAVNGLFTKEVRFFRIGREACIGK